MRGDLRKEGGDEWEGEGGGADMRRTWNARIREGRGGGVVYLYVPHCTVVYCGEGSVGEECPNSGAHHCHPSLTTTTVAVVSRSA